MCSGGGRWIQDVSSMQNHMQMYKQYIQSKGVKKAIYIQTPKNGYDFLNRHTSFQSLEGIFRYTGCILIIRINRLHRLLFPILLFLLERFTTMQITTDIAAVIHIPTTQGTIIGL